MICDAFLNGSDVGVVPIAHASENEKNLLFRILESYNNGGGVPIALTEFSLLPHKSWRPYFPSFLSALAAITIFIITALTI